MGSKRDCTVTELELTSRGMTIGSNGHERQESKENSECSGSVASLTQLPRTAIRPSKVYAPGGFLSPCYGTTSFFPSSPRFVPGLPHDAHFNLQHAYPSPVPIDLAYQQRQAANHSRFFVDRPPAAFIYDQRDNLTVANSGPVVDSGGMMYSKPRKRLRTVYSEAQVRLLEATYEEQKYPESSKRRWLAAKTGIPIDRLQVWFQNRRARDRRLKDERIVKNMEKGRENMAYISQAFQKLQKATLPYLIVQPHAGKEITSSKNEEKRLPGTSASSESIYDTENIADKKSDDQKTNTNEDKSSKETKGNTSTEADKEAEDIETQETDKEIETEKRDEKEMGSRTDKEKSIHSGSLTLSEKGTLPLLYENERNYRLPSYILERSPPYACSAFAGRHVYETSSSTLQSSYLSPPYFNFHTVQPPHLLRMVNYNEPQIVFPSASVIQEPSMYKTLPSLDQLDIEREVDRKLQDEVFNTRK